MKEVLSRRVFLPINYFGIALGTLALALAWRYAAAKGLVPQMPAVLLACLAMASWVYLLLAYLLKFLLKRAAVKAEFKNLIACCFFALIPITSLEAAILLLPHARHLAVLLGTLGLITQLAFSFYRTPQLWRGNHTLLATTPVIYLPAVAANFASAAYLGQIEQKDLGWLFFGAGVLSWLSLEPAILRRLRTETPLEPAARGALGIQLAPAFVGSVALLSLNGGKIDTAVLFLCGYGLLQLLYFLRLSPWLLEKGFTAGLWGFSFGLAAMANLGIHLVEANRLVPLGWAMFALGSATIALLWLGNIYLFLLSLRGRESLIVENKNYESRQNGTRNSGADQDLPQK